MANLNGVDVPTTLNMCGRPSYSTPNQHPPTVYAQPLQLHMCPHCMCHVSTHTLRIYVCACAPVPHVIAIVFKQFACLIYSLAHIQYMRAYRQRYYKYMQSHTTPTKRGGRSSHSTPHLGRQADNQHAFITGLGILPKVSKWTVTNCHLSEYHT